jgi:hypothetical protein
MEGVENQGQFTENQIQEVKVAMAEVLNDLQGGGGGQPQPPQPVAPEPPNV